MSKCWFFSLGEPLSCRHRENLFIQRKKRRSSYTHTPRWNWCRSGVARVDFQVKILGNDDTEDKDRKNQNNGKKTKQTNHKYNSPSWSTVDFSSFQGQKIKSLDCLCEN